MAPLTGADLQTLSVLGNWHGAVSTNPDRRGGSRTPSMDRPRRSPDGRLTRLRRRSVTVGILLLVLPVASCGSSGKTLPHPDPRGLTLRRNDLPGDFVLFAIRYWTVAQIS